MGDRNGILRLSRMLQYVKMYIRSSEISRHWHGQNRQHLSLSFCGFLCRFLAFPIFCSIISLVVVVLVFIARTRTLSHNINDQNKTTRILGISFTYFMALFHGSISNDVVARRKQTWKTISVIRQNWEMSTVHVSDRETPNHLLSANPLLSSDKWYLKVLLTPVFKG